MKKLLISLLTLLFVLSGFTAVASENPELVAEGTLSSVGRNTYLHINADNAEGLASFILSVEYDFSAFEYKGYEKEEGYLSVNKNESGRLTLVYLNEDGVSSSSQELFTLKFKNLGVNSTSLRITAFDAIDKAGLDISLSTEDYVYLCQDSYSDGKEISENSEDSEELAVSSTLYVKGDRGKDDIIISFALGFAIVFVMLLWLLVSLLRSRLSKDNKCLVYENGSTKNTAKTKSKEEKL